MKQILTLAAFLLTALPLHAGPADMNLYLMLWPEGEEAQSSATQVIELENGEIRIFTHITSEEDADKSAPATPEQITLLSAAVAAMLRTVSVEMGEEITGDRVAVEWSISNANTFERGSSSLREIGRAHV